MFLQFLNGAQLARIVNPFGFFPIHRLLLNLRGSEKTFLSDLRTHFLFLVHALQQSFIFVLLREKIMSCNIKMFTLLFVIIVILILFTTRQKFESPLADAENARRRLFDSLKGTREDRRLSS